MAKICMNEACQATTTLEWKKGWDLKSGGFAVLCYNCGSAYENSVFCETFHLQESGWRECRLCGKRIHCGCIVSKDLHHYLDFGGIGCIRCSKKLENRSLRSIKVRNDDNHDRFGPWTANNVGDPQSSLIEDKMDDFKVDKGKLIQLSKTRIAKNYRHIPRTQSDTDTSTGQIKKEGITLNGEVGIGFPDLMQQSVAQSVFVKSERARPALGVKDMYESLALPSLSFSLGMPLGTSNTLTPAPGGVVEGREWNKVPPFEQGQRTSHILPKPLKTGLTIGSDANKGTISQTRVARPPAEGRGRSLLLPRYWPRITDQELQQISGELNSTIVPLFEKVLSASDAGRIGRLVLPKACAEEYFPPISQSEGLPIRIQDIKGKEWTFQFRFWPNNNSRMYVLEGVTPCIQNMQLQAGDTVTFSRIDPGGKLVIGFRKASNSGDMHDCQPSAISNGTASGDTFFPGFNDNLPTDGSRSNEGMPHRSNLNPEKKKTRNIGSKSKRLFMHNEDAVELRFTWEEAQELLRPSPSAKPTIVMIEDQIFEEYDEPPVFGKRTIFTAGLSGKQEQWAQCDSCFKWRRLPVDFLVPPKWTCAENVWDSSRCSCSATGELNATELEHFLRVGRDFKKRRITESPTAEHHHEPSGLDALATAAVLGEHVEDLGEPSTGATTKHPRHRPGCTCIVCIQPPSGKGRHKPTCICNVCLTVKRRFKTLMLRKKKRQSERESEIAQEKEKVETFPSINDSEINGTNQNGLCKSPLDNERSQNNNSQLDLNCDPNREEEVVAEGTVLEMCTGENGITKPCPCLLSLDAGMSECHPPDKGCLSSIPGEHENGEHENKNDDS